MKIAKIIPAALCTSALLVAPQLNAAVGDLLFSESFQVEKEKVVWEEDWTLAVSKDDFIASDYEVKFGWDYSTLGIPAAPNSGGVTRGLKMAVNQFGPATAYSVTLTPNGQTFTGDYQLKFDMWINFNGPLGPEMPAGGTGSTEFVTAGVGKQTTSPQYLGASGDAEIGVPEGVWFAVDGEGGSGIDFRSFKNGLLQAPDSGFYHAGTHSTARRWSDPYYAETFPGGATAPMPEQEGPSWNPWNQTGETATGVVGFAWHEVTVSVRGDTVTWAIDGLPIATVTPEGGDDSPYSTTGNIFVGYMDIFSSVSDRYEVSFGVIANLTVHELLPEVGGYAAWADANLPEGARGADADPDGDGIQNLVEYALAQNPVVADVGGLPQGVVEEGALTLTVNKNPDAVGVDYVVEVSDDLVQWDSGSGFTTEIENTGEVLKVRDNTAFSASARRFIRLKVTQSQ